MITLTTHDDVTRAHLAHWRSGLVGYGVSVYLVRGVLIDTGFPAARGMLARLLDEWRPAAAVVTHLHEDHAGNAALVARRGLPIVAAPETLAVLRAGEPDVGVYRRFTWGALAPLTEPVIPYPVEELAARGLEVVHTPGHSPEHHVVWDAERRTLFAADLYLSVKVRVARPDENPRQLARSLRAVAILRPRRLFDAHRGEVPDPVAALLAKADWIDETISRIDALAAEGWSDDAIRREVLGREEAVRWASRGDLSKLNFVRAVRRRG